MPHDCREWPLYTVRVHWHPLFAIYQPRRLRSRFRAKNLYGIWLGLVRRAGPTLAAVCHRREGSGVGAPSRRHRLRPEGGPPPSVAIRPRLKDDYGVPDAHQVFHARGVPVGEANATVARSAANCLRIICAVNTDAGFVQAHPQNAHQIVWPRREIVIILSAHAVVQHAFIITEPWPDVRAENFP